MILSLRPPNLREALSAPRLAAGCVRLIACRQLARRCSAASMFTACTRGVGHEEKAAIARRISGGSGGMSWPTGAERRCE